MDSGRTRVGPRPTTRVAVRLGLGRCRSFGPNGGLNSAESEFASQSAGLGLSVSQGPAVDRVSQLSLTRTPSAARTDRLHHDSETFKLAKAGTASGLLGQRVTPCLCESDPAQVTDYECCASRMTDPETRFGASSAIVGMLVCLRAASALRLCALVGVSYAPLQ